MRKALSWKDSARGRRGVVMLPVRALPVTEGFSPMVWSTGVGRTPPVRSMVRENIWASRILLARAYPVNIPLEMAWPIQ